MKTIDKRRAFLSTVGASAVAAGAVATLGAAKPQVFAESAGVPKDKQAESKKGYQLTEHVRRYYETALS
jgi:hypothetical protein